MSRCGCMSECSCSIVAGDGIDVGGTGSALNPYTISAEPVEVEVTDTPTVDLDITGSGTSASPFDIKADVKVAGGADNCLVIQTDGLMVACPDGSETIVQGDGATTSIEGSGTETDPYIVRAISTAVPTPGCGIEVDESEISVNTGDAAWPYGCLQSSGQDLYCDETTGRLHGAPEKFYVDQRVDVTNAAGAVQFSALSTVGGPATQVGPTLSMTVDNPSDCHPLHLTVLYGATHSLVQMRNAGLGDLTLLYTLNIPQDANHHRRWRSERSAGDDLMIDSPITMVALPLVIPPGGSQLITLQLMASVLEDTGDNFTTGLISFIHAFGANP